jgi:phosphatidylglycerol lysyltransferase
LISRSGQPSDVAKEHPEPHRFPPGTGSKKWLRRIAGPAYALAVCAFVLLLVHGLSRGINYHAMVLALSRTPPKLVWLSIVCTALSYVALAAQDESALAYTGIKVPQSGLLLASICGSALGNVAGFASMTGGSVRARVYSALGAETESITRLVAFLKVGFGFGLIACLGSCAILATNWPGHLIPLPLLRAAGTILLLATGAALFAMTRRPRTLSFGGLSFTTPPLGPIVLQVGLTAAELGAAAGALWFLLPSPRLDCWTFAAIFCVANGLGLLSRMPAGLGVFDAVIFLALRNSLPQDQLAAAILVYRGTYFLLPLALAATALAGFELRRAGDRPASTSGERLLQGAGLLAPLFLSAATFGAGAMLVIAGATPASDRRLAVLQSVLPLWAVEISHLLATLAGVLLLFVARGLYHRLDGAWWLAFLIALSAVALSLVKGLPFGEMIIVLFLVLLLLATRREFTRYAAFLHQPFRIGWFIAVAAVMAGAIGVMFFAFRDVPYRREIWWQFEFDAQASRALRALLAASIMVLAVSLWQLLSTAPGRARLPSSEELSRALDIISGQPRSAATLALMGDKSFLFSRSGRAFLMYAKRGRSWIALFDPVGPYDEWSELIWRFVELADANDGRAAFYQIRPESLPLYLDAGLRVIKVGEEACIHLNDFTLEGSQRYGLRQALKRGERDGLTFALTSPPMASQSRAEIKHISDAWLASHRASERGFSVAAFEPGFVAVQSTAISCRHGQPIAFVTLMTANGPGEATIGLMRQMPDAPPYTMEFLITQVALQLKAQQFAVFSLGMAPLAGIVRTPLSSQWNRVGELLWRHSGTLYNFQGLRSFKNKFRPTWEPRYLAASGVMGPFISMAEIAALASGNRGGSSGA